MSTPTPLVSVVVPMYNDSRTVDLCLRSVLEQSYPAVEVIVVDDASTDDSAELAAAHAVTLVRAERNGGPGGSRNLGVRHAAGEILFFLDADLTMHPDAVARAVEIFTEHPEYGAVFGVPDKEPLFPEGAVGQYRILQYHYWRKSAEGLVSGGFYALGAVRRSAFLEAGWFNGALRQTEEIDHAERLAALHPMLLTSRIRGRLSDESRMRPLLRKAFVRSRLRVPFYLGRGRAMQGMETPGRAVASALAGLAVASLPLIVWQPLTALITVLAVAGFVLTDLGQYGFVRRERGLGFLAFFTLAHLLVNAVVLAGLVAGLAQFAVSGRFRRMYTLDAALTRDGDGAADGGPGGVGGGGGGGETVPGAAAEPPTRARRIARRLRTWYGWSLIALAALWLFYAVLRRSVSGRWHWAILLDATPPVFLVAIPLLLLVASAAACGRRRRWAAALALPPLLLALVTGSGLNWPALWHGERTVPAGALHVVSFNTQYWAASTDVDRLYDLVHRQNADVYLFQEHVVWQAGRGEDGYLRLDDDARLAAEFPGYHIARRGELLTVSRFPIVAQPAVGTGAELEPDAPFGRVFARDKVLRTDLQVGSKVFSVYNVHVTVPLAPDLDPFSDFDFDSYFRRKFDWRRAEIRGLEQDLAGNPHQVLISGDFNASASMRDLDGLRDRADDAIRANNDFLPLSWKFSAPAGFDWDSAVNRSFPFWRLDWSFTVGPVRVHRYDFRPTDGISEHRLQDLWLSL
ncbi:glycosyltransferase [Kitasatospora sp. NPDC058218]|uniref:glycosyltransferase n=1 Tax=Kitasatospora sp. NPDC058218 TaxID=3346385 RepID=UPI0036DED4C8